MRDAAARGKNKQNKQSVYQVTGRPFERERKKKPQRVKKENDLPALCAHQTRLVFFPLITEIDLCVTGASETFRLPATPTDLIHFQ